MRFRVQSAVRIHPQAIRDDPLARERLWHGAPNSKGVRLIFVSSRVTAKAISATMLISPRDNLYPWHSIAIQKRITIGKGWRTLPGRGRKSRARCDVSRKPDSSRFAREHRRLNIEWRSRPYTYMCKQICVYVCVCVCGHDRRVRLSRPPGRCYRSTKRTTAIAPTLLQRP